MLVRGLWIGDDWYDDPMPLHGSVSFFREIDEPDSASKKKKQKARTIGFTRPKRAAKQRRVEYVPGRT